MSCEVSLDDVVIKEEPPCEEHAAAALRVRESQVKLEPGECSDTQPAQERAGRAGTSASMQDLYLIYEGHVMKGEELAIGPEVWQQLAPPALLIYEGLTVEDEVVISPEVPQQPNSENTRCLPVPEAVHQKINHSSHQSARCNSKKTKNTRKQVPCKTCDNNLRSKYSLLRHQQIHDTETIFTCYICQNKLARKGYLNTHLRVHSGEKPFVCKVCKKKFSSQSDLTRHRRIHSGDKPFVCDICNKKFTQRAHLMTHLRYHSGEKPYACDICNKKFTERSKLIFHLRVHSGEKPFSCDICKRKFSLDRGLKRHLLRTHNK